MCIRDSLILVLYHDEVEICNPLGSHATIHKLDQYYYTIANLEPQYRSKHAAVRLLSVVNAKLVKKYGVEQILRPALILNSLYFVSFFDKILIKNCIDRKSGLSISFYSNRVPFYIDFESPHSQEKKVIKIALLFV